MGQNSSEVIAEGNQSHERLGIIKVYEVSDMFNEHDNLYRLQLKKSIESQQKFEKWLTNLRQIDSEQARDILYLPLSFQFEKTSICGSSGYLTVTFGLNQLTFEHFPYVLKSEIRNRRKMSQYFQESQLWYLLYNLVEAGTIFEKKKKKVGDIHPNNCLLNENGQFKLIASCSIPDETTNYDKIIDSPTNDAFLAPQEIDSTLIEKGIYPNVDVCRAEVYCIGMTLLQAATLEDCFYTYSRGPYKINKKRLADLLKIVKEKYRKTFYDFLFNMLEENLKRRKRCSEFFNELLPYEEAILQLRDFSLASGQTENAEREKKEQNIFTQQSTVHMQKPNPPFGYAQNAYISNTNNSMGQNTQRSFGVKSNQGSTNNQTIAYTKPGGQNPLGYRTVSYSTTSIDNGLRK